MTDYLAFTLYGPLASWGGIAVGERRDSDVVPTRSAVLGIVSASLGIRRGETERLALLRSAVGVAVQVDRAGILLQDYHTANVPPARFAGKWSMRGDGLRLAKRAHDLSTVLSWRDYRCDALYRVALWLRDTRDISLDMLRDALRRPIFALSLGRRSCVPACPLMPHIVAGDSLEAAFNNYVAAKDVGRIDRRYLHRVQPRARDDDYLIACDVDGAIDQGGSVEVTRRDEPKEYRSERWVFDDRKERRRQLRRS